MTYYEAVGKLKKLGFDGEVVESFEDDDDFMFNYGGIDNPFIAISKKDGSHKFLHMYIDKDYDKVTNATRL